MMYYNYRSSNYLHLGGFMHTFNKTLRNLLVCNQLNYSVTLFQCNLHVVLMDFFKLNFLPRGQCKFSYSLTITTMQETNILTSNEKQKYLKLF